MKSRKGITGIIIAVVLTAFIIISVVGYFWLAPKIFFKDIDAAHGIIDQTYTADNAIYNYEWFKTQYEKIQATEKQIDNTMMQKVEFKELYGEASTWDFTTKESYSRISTTLLGQKNHYEDIVAEYNARSKMANRNIFKNKLPFNVDKKMW